MTQETEHAKREVDQTGPVDIDTLKKQRDRNAGNVHSEYASLEEFQHHALSSEWHVSQDRIHIADIPYTLSTYKDVNFNDVLARKKPGVVIYKQAGRGWAEEGKKVGLDQWVVIVWRIHNGNILKPGNVVSTRPHVFSNRVSSSGNLGEAVTPAPAGQQKDKDNLIGNHASVKITSLPNSQELKALVDTGATICSLHAEKWKIDGQSVRFVCKELSGNVITLPLVSQMSVKSGDGGTEYRPVVELNIRVNGTKIVQGVQFNLNNRQHMDHSVLLGANFLKQAKMLIDPNMTTESVEEISEEVDWDSLMTELEPFLTESVEEEPTNIQGDIVSLMMKSDLTMAELVREIRKLEYAQETPIEHHTQ